MESILLPSWPERQCVLIRPPIILTFCLVSLPCLSRDVLMVTSRGTTQSSPKSNRVNTYHIGVGCTLRYILGEYHVLDLENPLQRHETTPHTPQLHEVVVRHISSWLGVQV